MMKKIVLLLFSISFLLASVAKITALKGDVVVVRNSDKITAKVGIDLEEKDTIKTDNNAMIQLLFNDETIVTIGKNSQFSIKRYFFDFDKTNNSNGMIFTALKGSFRVMTGRISKIAPQNFKLITKTALIGIRGTHFFGYIKDDEDIIACTKGHIIVSSLDGSNSVLLKSSEITFIKNGLAPRAPRALVEDVIKEHNIRASYQKEADIMALNNGFYDIKEDTTDYKESLGKECQKH